MINSESRVRYSDSEPINELLSEIAEKIRSLESSPGSIVGNIVDDVTTNVREFTEQQLNLKKKLTRIGSALSAERNLDTLLEMIVVEAMNFTNADGGTIYIMTPDEKSISFKILQNRSMNIRMGGTTGKPITFPPVKLYKDDGSRNEQQVSAYVALTGKTVNIADVYDAEGFDFQGTKKFDAGTGYRSKSMMVIAMRNHENEIIGVLQLLNAMDRRGNVIPFSSDYQELIESLASQAAVAITNTTLIHDLKALLDSFIQVIASAIDEKSPYTGGHIRRVAELTQAIARGMSETDQGLWKSFRMNEDEHNELRIAAWMHDIGKITTPEYVVDKATKLETIYDRVNSVVGRFELLRQQTMLEYYKKKEKLSAGKGKDRTAKLKALEKTHKATLKQIDEDCEFIKTCNIGGEFMEDAKIERLKRIAAQKINIGMETIPFLSENEVYNLSIRRGTLTNEERLIIQNHVVLTIKMLQQLPWPKKLRRVTEWAGAHHEALNGKGYPYGLTAEQLSTQARIMAIADIFEALTAADRPYKPGKKISESIKILLAMVKEGHLDADIVDYFIKSGLARDYARRELKDYQLDVFEYDGQKYDCRRDGPAS
jgi:HD-GYP domain-containing protein (c-di-GMP phosphodiesterase class II)